MRARAEEARANIQVGSIVKGRVVSVKEYGVFVDLGGIEGMIHVSELTHNRSAKPSDVVKVGDEVEAKVLRPSRVARPCGRSARRGTGARRSRRERGRTQRRGSPCRAGPGRRWSGDGRPRHRTARRNRRLRPDKGRKSAKGSKKDKKKPRGRPVESLPRVVAPVPPSDRAGSVGRGREEFPAGKRSPGAKWHACSRSARSSSCCQASTVCCT